MKKRILLTGGTGFIGRNIKPSLSMLYDVFSPKRRELDLFSTEDVRQYVITNRIDYIIHSANPLPAENELDKKENMFEDSIRMFVSIYGCRDLCEKIVYFGSGAEFDKRFDIISARENSIGVSIPNDVYGCAKYVMNEMIQHTDNVINLRIFGCYGPTDHDYKFITHLIINCIDDENLTINQDCYFDFMQVDDLVNVIQTVLSNNTKFHDYNVCTGNRILLSEIAKIVANGMNSKKPIVIKNKGLNKEYTGSNLRLITEFPDIYFTSIEEGIKTQIEYELKKRNQLCSLKR